MYCFTLLKKGQIHTTKGKIIPREEFSELLTAKQILEKAQEEATRLIEEAKATSSEIHAEAKAEGFDEGLQQFQAHLLLFEEHLRTLRLEMQRVMLPLVVKATKRIVGEELKQSPESIVDIVLQAIKQATQAKVVRLYINKEDLPYVEQERERIKESFEGLTSFSIEARSDVAQGGCIIETEKGVLNATLENQFRALERALEAHKKR